MRRRVLAFRYAGVMRWSIRNQIFVPFALLLATAAATSAVTSAILSARYAAALEVEQLTRVLVSLDHAGFPYTDGVLQQMRGLSGADFITVDGQGRVKAGTLPGESTPALGPVPAITGATRSLGEFPSVEIGGRPYLVAVVPVRAVSPGDRLYVLYPRQAWRRLQWSAAWPPLAVGAGTLLLMLAASGWIAHRFGARIESVRRLFSRIEKGEYPRLNPPTTRDELFDLIESANGLSARLESLNHDIARTERLRVLAQLAGGFAHQLRNAVTGARLAVQLHQRQCPVDGADDTLTVALAQLRLTEQQVQGLLSLSREPSGPAEPGDLGAIVREVETLLRPHFRHQHVELTVGDSLTEPVTIADRDSLRAALLNLGLNALEAAGPHGQVEIVAEQQADGIELRVADTGSGPPAGIRERLFEPFVTSKPEGIGLGLALAHQAAERHRGTLAWSRVDERTVFRIRLPRPDEAAFDPSPRERLPFGKRFANLEPTPNP